MAKLIIDGSQIKCTLGTKPEAIKVSSQTFVKIGDKLIATEGDKAGMQNVPSFGNCKRSSNQPACTPQPQGWTNVTPKDAINGNKKLTIDSTCPCSFGGTISFVDTSSNSFVDAE